ncbi:hypothetical protein BH09GEM1_BH09GEM1_07490 [soil metagenome]
MSVQADFQARALEFLAEAKSDLAACHESLKAQGRNSSARSKALANRIYHLEDMADPDMCQEWGFHPAIEAELLFESSDEDAQIYARLVLEFWPKELIAQLASWEAGQPWGSADVLDDYPPWQEDEAAKVRRVMALAMVTHGHLMKP